MGFINNNLVTLDNNPTETLLDVICNHTNIAEAEMVTLYYGDDIEQEEAEAAIREIRQRWPQVEVEAVYGGQPHYSYIASVE